MDTLEWEKIDEDNLKLALEQGEKILRETIDTANFQVNRALTMLKAIIGLIIGLVAYLSSTIPTMSLLYLEASLGLVVLVILLPLAFKAYRTYIVEPLGNSPNHILNQKNIDYGGDKLKQFLLFNCCRSVEDSIKSNQQSNQERASLLTKLELEISVGLIGVIIFPVLWFLVSRFLFE
ncbi:MAG: hypothetical protein JXR03_04670 [Cyclobacteriaceae bacterium]